MATETYETLNADSVMSGMERVVYDYAIGLRMSDESAMKCVRGLIDVLYLNFKGQLMYIPTGDGSDRADLYNKVYHEFTGRNHAELAVKYRHSVQWVYNVIRRRHDSAIRALQDDLFPFDIAPEVEHRPVLLQIIAEYLPAEWMRAGMAEADANKLAGKLAAYTIEHYPGIAITISEGLHRRHTDRYLPGLL